MVLIHFHIFQWFLLSWARPLGGFHTFRCTSMTWASYCCCWATSSPACWASWQNRLRVLPRCGANTSAVPWIQLWKRIHLWVFHTYFNSKKWNTINKWIILNACMNYNFFVNQNFQFYIALIIYFWIKWDKEGCQQNRRENSRMSPFPDDPSLMERSPKNRQKLTNRIPPVFISWLKDIGHQRDHLCQEKTN